MVYGFAVGGLALRLLWFWTQMRAKTDHSEAEIPIATSKALAEVTTYLESDYAAFEVSICFRWTGRYFTKGIQVTWVSHSRAPRAPTLGKCAFHLM